MKKIKILNLVILGFILFFSFTRISKAQEDYVGIQNGDEFEWELSVHTENWNTYLADDLEDTIEYLFPLGTNNLTSVYDDWNPITTLPQSVWPFSVTTIGSEETGQKFSPIDNSTITSTPINGSTGYEIVTTPSINSNWDENWEIVNDTSSFLGQTRNLSIIFGVYPMMGIPFAPTNINWSLFVNNFLGVMSSKGGLYKNISAIAQSEGFLISIPALGFESNSVPIEINVRYNSKGTLSYYEFSYGGQTLVDFTLDGILQKQEERERQELLNQYIIVIIVLCAILLAEVIYSIPKRKR